MMIKNIKKEMIQYGVIIIIVGGLYFTGLHTEVIGFAQRALLATGIMNPDIGNKKQLLHENEFPDADFGLQLLNSKCEQITLKQVEGKVIFMNFWATWCPPCIAEMPSINKLYKEMAGEDIVFIMLSMDNDFEKAKSFIKKKGYSFEIYQYQGSLPEKYNSNSLPTTYVIDSQGKLVLTHMGMADYYTKDFKNYLAGLK